MPVARQRPRAPAMFTAVGGGSGAICGHGQFLEMDAARIWASKDAGLLRPPAGPLTQNAPRVTKGMEIFWRCDAISLPPARGAVVTVVGRVHSCDCPRHDRPGTDFGGGGRAPDNGPLYLRVRDVLADAIAARRLPKGRLAARRAGGGPFRLHPHTRPPGFRPSRSGGDDPPVRRARFSRGAGARRGRSAWR